MSKNLLIRLGIALGVAIVVWGLLALVRRPPDDRSGSLALPRVDSTKTDTIVFATAQDTAVLTHGAGAAGRWRVNGFPATQAAVSDLLKGLADTSRSTELVAESRASHERLGVALDSAEHVRVVSGGRAVLDLMVGKRTPDYSGVYVRRATDDAVYSLHGSLADPLGRAIGDWRDKHVVSVSPDSVGTIEVRRAGSTYTLQRAAKGSGWTFASNPGAKPDSSAIGTFLSDYRDLNASGFATAAQTDSIKFAKASRHTRLLSKSGTTLAGFALDSTASGNWMRADSGHVIYKLDSWLWDRLAPAESTLRVKPPVKPVTPAAKKASAKKK